MVRQEQHRNGGHGGADEVRLLGGGGVEDV